MTRIKWRTWTIAAVLGLAAGCAAPGLGTTDQAGQGGSDAKKQLSGAIFTTTSDGTRVDANQYAKSCDVYLNGGPERTGAAGLPEGDYYFMVTEPSASHNSPPSLLLSTDAIEARLVHISADGVFESVPEGGHVTGENHADGGITVQLCPFMLSANQGCVHKVWLTPVEDYDPSNAQNTFGFDPSRSKTDNFRVCEATPPPPPPPPTTPPVCGNGILEGDEECDDGNRINGDGCTNICTEEET